MRSHAVLMLEDGRHFVGKPLGADRLGVGEVVFNTAMTGYQEILTDPSYAGQMLCMTYPLQGNYGVRRQDAESDRIWARAFIARWASPAFSHHSAEATLHDYLVAQGVPGIRDIDTRALTRHLRTHGTMRAVLTHEDGPIGPERLDELLKMARKVTPLSLQDLVGPASGTRGEVWVEPLPSELRPAGVVDASGLKVAVLDYGVKNNILRSLASRGCEVRIMPYGSSLEQVLAQDVDGVVLSNGPGDPAVLAGPVELARGLIEASVPLLGICLGHQIIGLAAGATTSRLGFGHHGANHPVKDLITGRVHITSQNHEFQIDAASLPEGDFFISQLNLNDGSVEGLASRTRPVFSVQYHPEGAPGPADNQYVFDRFVEMVRSRRPLQRVAGGASAEARPRKVLIIGSGPIVIGQAAEFDYAGTQACKALREEGVATVLVNSNPATIMTDEEVADRVYIEPLTVESLERIIERERPDAVLPTLGGQTGLNLAMELAQAGVLERHQVRFLGADAEVIRKAEDRQAFKSMLIEIGEPVPPSEVCASLEEARAFLDQVGLPLVVRPAYTLGGTGGGFVREPADFDRVVRAGLAASPISQVLVERSLWGWKELEYEVMRDAAGTCVTICNMENLDPMGVHTGDSMVVAPAQTLSDRDHQMLRSSAIKIIQSLGLEGGCNVQFALDPESSTYYVIEVNPRVSRSSALASKATGYPIARVAAKVAIGLRLEEITNQVTGKTFAAFEPALDYCVVKIPRWPFDKFPQAGRTLGTQMASTGEVMAIERTFEGALAKALLSLEQRQPQPEDLRGPEMISVPNDRRLFALMDRLRRGSPPARLAAESGIDVWFLDRLAELVADWPPAPVGSATYKLVDTCAGEFEAETPYFYSCHEEEDEAVAVEGKAALVVGSGPIRIGQGIEFDYCSVHAAWALDEAGYRSIMINSNPETVSTDFDTSDRLYFEPLDSAHVNQVAQAESVAGVVVQFGGQTAINLADSLSRGGVEVLGSSVHSIDLAEDRRAFARALESLGIPQPVGDTTTTVEEALRIAERVGYPVLVRPSYVLGGRAMEIVRDASELTRYMGWAKEALPRGHVLVDKYLMGVEIEVDAVADGETVVIPGVMRHVERAGVHSGDSYAVYPAYGLDEAQLAAVVDHTVRIARHLELKGLLNIQYVVHRGTVYVLEVNPRASRTVPLISKVTGVPLVRLATRVMLGESLLSLGYETGLVPDRPLVAVKAPVFSMNKLPTVESYLGPEMKSTGEVMGVAADLPSALRKAFVAAGMNIGRNGQALFTIADADKPEMFAIASGLVSLGFQILATEGTARALQDAGFSAVTVGKIGDQRRTVLDVINSGEVSLVINTMTGTVAQEVPGLPVFKDGYEIRRAAVERRIPCLTSLDTAAALVESTLASGREMEVRTIDEWRRGR